MIVREFYCGFLGFGQRESGCGVVASYIGALCCQKNEDVLKLFHNGFTYCGDAINGGEVVLIWWVTFAAILLVPVVFVLLYAFFACRQNYDVGRITASVRDKAASEQLVVLRNALQKVNGWNLLCTMYASLYYCFNLWSVAFAIFSVIVISGDRGGVLVELCSVIVSMLLCCTLFLKLDRKWMAFKRLLARARIRTNNLLSRLDGCADPGGLIKHYANSIIRLENALDEDDLL